MSVSLPPPQDPARPADSGISLALLVQGAVVTLALLAAILAPPEEGPMMVIPLDGGRMAQTMAWASGDGSALLGIGPLPGSVLVYGKRKQVTQAAWQHNSIVVKAPAIFCGSLSSTPRKS